MFFQLFIGSSVGLGLFLLLVFSVLQWFQVSAGSFLDWVIGGASFWWLAVIVTIPWNIYFQAKAVLAEAAQSDANAIPVEPQQLAYVQRLTRWALPVALGLHGISVLGLYLLSAFGISAIGYVGSGAALLLTGLRPAIAGYDYLATRLATIRQTVIYPREDIVELRQRVQTLETSLEDLQRQLDPATDSSWVAQYQRLSQELRGAVAQSAATLEHLRAENHLDHERLAREARQGIAQLSSDGQFLDHVREIIRFFKTA